LRDEVSGWRHVKLHDEQLILGLAQNLIEEAETGAALGLQHLLLTHTGIDHQSDGERQIRVLGKITDGLCAAVFGKREVVFRQVVDDLVLPRAHSGEHVDHFDAGCERCFILLGARERAGPGSGAKQPRG
jgi:hypothetical protein